MTLTDDNHRTARLIKDIEQRVSDLEQRSRSSETPNILITTADRAGTADRVDTVRSQDLVRATWGGRGWRTSTWGAVGGR